MKREQIFTPHRDVRMAGFTLVEALMAVVILSFGLMSIANLSIVAISSNSVANRSSAATMIAAQQLEVLRSTPFSSLVATSIDTINIPTIGYERGYGLPTAAADPPFNLEGVAEFVTTWRIQTLSTANMLFIQVRTEPRGFRGRRSRAEFTTVRTCTGGTTTGCPL
ncbi:MAG: hypothetical protein ABIP62_00315 [Vicinamibacteria bacterium]